MVGGPIESTRSERNQRRSALQHSNPWACLTSNSPRPWPPLPCCPGEVQTLLSSVMHPVKNVASSPTHNPWDQFSHVPQMGKSKGEKVDVFPSSVPHSAKKKEAGPALLCCPGKLWSLLLSAAVCGGRTRSPALTTPVSTLLPGQAGKGKGWGTLLHSRQEEVTAFPCSQPPDCSPVLLTSGSFLLYCLGEGRSLLSQVLQHVRDRDCSPALMTASEPTLPLLCRLLCRGQNEREQVSSCQSYHTAHRGQGGLSHTHPFLSGSPITSRTSSILLTR